MVRLILNLFVFVYQCLIFDKHIGLLREAEEKYDSIEPKPKSLPPLTLVVHIVKTEESAAESTEGGEGGEEGTTAPPKATLKEVIIEIPMKPTDSIKSLQKKLNVSRY